MEDYLIKPPKLNTFAKIMFFLLSSVCLILLGMLIFMQINDSLKATNGEIFASNTPIEYKAYLDGEVKQVLVNEGDQVILGDTLVVIENELLATEYKAIEENYLLEQNNLVLNKKELAILSSKLSALLNQKNLNYANKTHTNSIADIEIQSLEKKIQSLEQKVLLSGERLIKDKRLLDEGLISSVIFEEKSRNHIDEMNILEDVKKEYRLKKSSKTGNKNLYLEKKQNLKLTKIDLEKEIIGLEKIIFQQETMIQTLAGQKDLVENEIKKMSIIAEADGIVSTVFNEKRKTRFISKGTPLLTIRPIKQQNFSARLQISQHAVAKVHAGQQIHLKLDAYNYYQYGILKGTIKAVNPKDTTNQFYILVELPEVPPSFDLQTGYKVKGDIILRKMKLYRFMMERLFGKLR